MAGGFRTVATRLSGLVSLSLGWSPELFWRCTPQELAVIFAASASHGMAADAKPLTVVELQQLKNGDPDG